MARGRKPGTPKTGGRKKGSLNKHTTGRDFVAAVEANLHALGLPSLVERAVMMLSSEDVRERITAFRVCAEYGLQKPPQAIEATGAGGGPIAFRFVPHQES